MRESLARGIEISATMYDKIIHSSYLVETVSRRSSLVNWSS